MRDIFRWQDI